MAPCSGKPVIISGVSEHHTNDQAPRARVRKVVITADTAGQRVDNFLQRELKGVPKSRVYRLLRKGEVRVNGRRIDAAYRLGEGDEVRVPPVRTSEPAEPVRPPDRLLQELQQRIIYEDDRLLVLDKPPGLAVHGGSGLQFGLIEALRALRPKAPFLELVHRLDRETSGCLVVAKKRSALREMHELLRTGRVEKRYLTLLLGRLPRGVVPVEAPLDSGHKQGGERVVRVASSGKAARTVFRTVARYGGYTLAEADIATGRTHQIRVHAAHLGYPVLGDARYGDKDANQALRKVGLRRLFLHAQSLEFDWGDGRPPLSVSTPLSEDLRRVLAVLEEKEPGVK